MENWPISPNEGMGPLRLGSSRDEVWSSFGKPDKTARKSDDLYRERGIVLHYDEQDVLGGIDASKKTRVTYQGQLLFEIGLDATMANLRNDDPHPIHAVGSVYFTELGIGIYVEPENQINSIGVFRREEIDKVIEIIGAD